MIYKKILLLYKDRQSLARLSRTLENVGHKVFDVDDTSKAIELLREESAEMVIASDEFRNPDVFELCQLIKEDDNLLHRSTKFLVISSKETPQAKKKANEAKVDELIPEPFTLPILVDRINSLLSAENHQAPGTELSGSIAQTGLVDILQLIEFSAKNGVLTVSSGMRRGTMTFAMGQLIKARVGKIHDEAAVYEMLSWKEGDFFFQALDMPENEADTGVTPLASVSSLVLEWARFKDEGKGKPTSAPQEYGAKEPALNLLFSMASWLDYLREK